MRYPTLFLKPVFIVFLLQPFPAPAAERIVSLKPNLTEILFALGAGSEVVGDVVQTRFPPQAAALPKVGGYTTPDLERIIALRPTLVVTLKEGTPPMVVSALKRARIRVVVFETDSLRGLYRTIEDLGREIGRESLGRILSTTLQQRIFEVSFKENPLKNSGTREGGVDGREPPTVLMVVQRRPIMVAGGGTFLGELITLGGGRNPFAASKLAYPTVGEEQIVAARPDVILDLSMEGGEPDQTFWKMLGRVPAVAEGRVYPLAAHDFLAGPRLPEGLRRIVQLIHAHP